MSNAVSSAVSHAVSHSPAVRTRGLVKRYRSNPALRGVDLEIPAGSMVLLVGPNGAGKSTLLGVLMDLIPFDEGSVEVLGFSPRSEGAWVRAGTGYLPESIDFPFDGLQVREVLAFLARFRPSWDAAYAERLARQLDLRLDQKWRRLSRGETRRAQLVATLAHRPPLLLLDEPTDGLDPVIRETVLGILAEHLAETGATTLFCTHVLHEAQGLADRILVLKAGQIRLHEDVEALHRTLFRARLGASGPGSSAPFTPPAPLPDAFVREEARSGSEARWIMRGEPSELRHWAAGAGVEILDLEPLSVADAALAYLSPVTPRRESAAMEVTP
jgi:ABC-2 type transport system ATP-binding protein